MRIIPLTIASAFMLLAGSPFHATANLPTDEFAAVNRVRFFPAPGHEKDMLGGRIMGSNDPHLPTIWTNGSRISLDSFQVLAEVKTLPPAGQWSELTFPNTQPYRWVVYAGPSGSYGRVAEVQFYDGTTRLGGEPFNSASAKWRAAFDDKTDTWFEGNSPDRQFVGREIDWKSSGRTPTMNPAPGEFNDAVTVALQTVTKGAQIRYTTDGTMPAPDNGLIYTGPLTIARTTTLCAVTCKDGVAPSPPTLGTYIVGSPVRRKTFHVGNSLTATALGNFSLRVASAGCVHDCPFFGLPGAATKKLWDVSSGVGNDIEKGRWTASWADGAGATKIDDFTFQPRDFNIPEEADYAVRFLKLVRQKSPDVQPWIYTEWTEKIRTRPTDRGVEPTTEMKKTWPALTWQESMAGMLLYVEDLQRKIAETDKGGKAPRVLPTALAMGWIDTLIQQGKLPGVPKDAFWPEIFRDDVHGNNDGAYLVQLTWYAAFYGQSPEGKVLPLMTNLTAQQALVMQRLAWDVIKNYPDCGYYEKGTTPVENPQFSPASTPLKQVTPVTLLSATPGVWFRYTLDGTAPTRTNGYIYCGVVSVRPGMTVKAIAYKSGMADSTVVEAQF